MQKSLVSIIIPVYNGANYLREAVDSALNQTYQNCEVIVVNDGSDDNGKTEEIALSYGSRIRYFRKENGGVATALNAGIREMQGEYFSWLSHDDVFYPRKIEEQVKCVKENNVWMTACSYDIFTDSGRRVAVPLLQFYKEGNLEKNVFSVIQSLIQFGGVLLHECIFERYGTFREDLRTTQDYEFLFRILRKEKCKFSNEHLYGIRYHAEQGSNTIRSVDIERDEMYRMFLDELTHQERVELYGSDYNFFYQMLLRIFPIPGMEKSYSACLQGMRLNTCIAGEIEEKIETPIWIYGAGAYGKRLLFDLRCRGFAVEGFLDGNKKLHGKKIDGIICRGLGEQGMFRGRIIIASLYREEIAQELRRAGISNYVFKEDLDKILMDVSPQNKIVEKIIGRYQENGWR